MKKLVEPIKQLVKDVKTHKKWAISYHPYYRNCSDKCMRNDDHLAGKSIEDMKTIHKRDSGISTHIKERAY